MHACTCNVVYKCLRHQEHLLAVGILYQTTILGNELKFPNDFDKLVICPLLSAGKK